MTADEMNALLKDKTLTITEDDPLARTVAITGDSILAPQPHEIVIVIADRREQAQYWCRRFGIDRRDLRYLTEPHGLLGFPRSTKVITVGPCETPKTYELVAAAQDRGFTVQHLRK